MLHLAGIDEVVAVIQGQQRSAGERLQAIGSPDSRGELADAAARWQAATAELRRIENILDPDRPEAVHDQLRDDLLLSLTASLERLAVEDKPTVRPAPTALHRAPPHRIGARGDHFLAQ